MLLKKTIISLIITVIVCSGAAFAEDELLYEIRIPAVVGEQAIVIDKAGGVREIGEVLSIPQTTRYPSYSASAWGRPGAVSASAVNAIHILVSVENDKGRTISIIPKETIAPAAGVGAAFVLSSPADSGIFSAWAPPSGTDVYILSPNGSINKLSKTTLPKAGDFLVMRVFQQQTPYFVEIENRPGGRVTAWDSSGYSVVARVIKPVAGTGRFEGTLFQNGSRLRANHPGVIDLSTAAKGQIGGFQIIPWEHALRSKEMQGAWDMTQWMIIGPTDGVSTLAGSAPLFNGALIPGPAAGEKLWDVWSTYGRMSLVLVRINGSEWQKMPEISGRVDLGLKDVTHLRIYYPTSEEPQKE